MFATTRKLSASSGYMFEQHISVSCEMSASCAMYHPQVLCDVWPPCCYSLLVAPQARRFWGDVYFHPDSRTFKKKAASPGQDRTFVSVRAPARTCV